ncbi:SIMPL domain-containing protein [Herbidospora cretacea]|uniref:SIMPL domain-containing protein n=1 Tax=Herbidospora cretacea TaxID=28444 RepID=UPI000774592F|nr:SIMPL domain-containing protein [Herbidospora cretacea]
MITFRYAAAAAFLAAGLVSAPLAAPAFASTSVGYAGIVADDAKITVTGNGTVSAAPDRMRLQAGVEVRRASAGAAFSGARTAAATLRAALLAAGVAEDDLRTSEISLGPEYDDYPKVSGYRAGQGVEVLVRDLDIADRVVDAVASAGEEARLNGISFEIGDPARALAAARDAAYKDALAKARQYAGLTGRTLGAVLRLEEDSDGRSPIPFEGIHLMAASDKSISPGRQSVGVSVKVVYELR